MRDFARDQKKPELRDKESKEKETKDLKDLLKKSKENKEVSNTEKLNKKQQPLPSTSTSLPYPSYSNVSVCNQLPSSPPSNHAGHINFMTSGASTTNTPTSLYRTSAQTSPVIFSESNVGGPSLHGRQLSPIISSKQESPQSRTSPVEPISTIAGTLTTAGLNGTSSVVSTRSSHTSQAINLSKTNIGFGVVTSPRSESPTLGPPSFR